jgi:hypothetical protein
MRLSGLATMLLRLYAAVVAGSLILGAPAAALTVLAVAIANLAVIGSQLQTFGRLMQQIVETVARQARLMPAEPLAGGPLSLGKARTI